MNILLVNGFLLFKFDTCNVINNNSNNNGVYCLHPENNY